MSFEVNKLLLADKLLFVIGEKVDHSCEAWRDWLLEFRGQEDAYGRKAAHFRLGKVAHADGIDVLVEDHCGDEEALRLVAFLFVQVHDPLHPVFPIDGAHEPVAGLRIALGVVDSGQLILIKADAFVARLREFGMLLPRRARLQPLIKQRALFVNVRSVQLGKVAV